MAIMAEVEEPEDSSRFPMSVQGSQDLHIFFFLQLLQVVSRKLDWKGSSGSRLEPVPIWNGVSPDTKLAGPKKITSSQRFV